MQSGLFPPLAACLQRGRDADRSAVVFDGFSVSVQRSRFSISRAPPLGSRPATPGPPLGWPHRSPLAPPLGSPLPPPRCSPLASPPTPAPRPSLLPLPSHIPR